MSDHRVHYVRDFDDAFAVCGEIPGRATDSFEDVSCNDCKREMI